MTKAEKIEAIRNLPSELDDALSGMSEAELDTPWRDGGWTPRQIVHHIADSHTNAFIRMKLIQTEDHPTLKPYSQDAWAKMNDYSRDITPSLDIINGIQERMANVLEDATDADLARRAHHPENGTMTLQNLLDLYAEHGRNHVDQIRKVKARVMN